MSNLRATSTAALGRLITPQGNCRASGGPLYSAAMFGRDSLEAAEDVAPWMPQEALAIACAVASLQGVLDVPPGDHSSEEQVGRIHHEHRARIMDGHPVDEEAAALLRRFGDQWGGSDEGFTYYGTVDATPLFVRLVGRLAQLQGKAVLTTPVTDKAGRQITLEDAALRAIGWIERRLLEDSLGLLSCCRTNPTGIANQVWRDGGTAYASPTGVVADPSNPLATIEVQGLVVDALLVGVSLGLGSSQDRSRWLATARRVAHDALHSIGTDDRGYPFAAVSETPHGPRQIELISSAPATLLDTSLPSLLGKDGARLIGRLASVITGEQFSTAGGVRTLSLCHAGLYPYDHYHGSSTTWPKESYDIIKGLRRVGDLQAARNLARSVANLTSQMGLVEFAYVTPDGAVVRPNQSSREGHTVVGTNLPESPQAWTASAAFAITHDPLLSPGFTEGGHANTTNPRSLVGWRETPGWVDLARGAQIEQSIYDLAAARRKGIALG